MANPVTQQLLITGQVQGVGFRAFVKHHAVKLGVSGWVRNLNEGSVEVLASAEGEILEKLITLCREGPSASRVDDIKITESQEKPEQGFRQYPTR